MASLYDQCDAFYKLAESPKISVEKNSNPTLRELSEIKDFDDRIAFAKRNWDFLGEGSSRTAFQINDKLIIKIAHNERGIAQNLTEMKPSIQTECVNNALIADTGGKWIVFRSTDKMTKDDFERIVGFSFRTFMNSLFYTMNNESDKWAKPKELDAIKQNDLFMCLARLVFENQLLIGDLDKISSWGLVDGKPVIRDAGLDKETYNKYYSDDSGDSSSSEPRTSAISSKTSS